MADVVNARLSFPLPDRFPDMIPVRQELESPECGDVRRTVLSELSGLQCMDRVRPGQSVALTGGSRGIAAMRDMLAATCEWLKERGALPFIVPAMGSHGGGTAQGQEQVLTALGITEQSVGAPIRSSMETMRFKDAPCGAPVHMDRLAATADHIILLNRIKPHTKFKGHLESGVMKMLAIGLGKAEGARNLHQWSISVPFPRLIESVGTSLVEQAPVLAGIGVVENHLGRPAAIQAMAARDLVERESRLLELAKRLHPRLPLDDLDILIVDEIGKNISGTGMDTNVTGRNRDILGPFADTPRIKRIVVLGLTRETKGNALGIGFADFTTSDVVRSMDYEATVLNAMTGISPEKAAIPIHLPTQREAFAAALASLGAWTPENVAVARIQNTLRLEHLHLSPGALQRSLDRVAPLEHGSGPAFDQAGRLAHLFPDNLS